MVVVIRYEYDEEKKTYLYYMYLNYILSRKFLRYDEMISNVMSLKRAYNVKKVIYDFAEVIQHNKNEDDKS